ncbi:hypothetical protein MBM_00300 [Drepanopeziza brunnea f. sp. 'multigermtubi' MB_m1]|uniref:C2H2-type domain-containing protein n=1 Tax=Marssonina brunnea f. sp. multigermtubi (strain MB_m1) TaxID=1072389 RepID=K1X7Z8_MARBU|nr:uncharacterized protein MBM_00300 [Drepanopeziza brunnea f. sp. 'multigermtubi' MB_m1]EKD21187.1 hypothetical protein MBM_00300 [Drepanopeziza brunnea f. sp. 'multigermtubi' MB_m1]
MVNCPEVGCSFTCHKARGMSNHRVAKHPPATPYQFVCTVVAVPACNMSFPTKANLAQHVRRIHPAPGVDPKPFLCPIICCGTRSDSLADQKKHMRGPHGLFPCPVPKCKEVQFRTALEMQHHQQTVHGSVALSALPAPPAPVAPVAPVATPAPALPAHAAPVAQMTTPVAPVAQMTTPAVS